jgi:hypothetical protein
MTRPTRRPRTASRFPLEGLLVATVAFAVLLGVLTGTSPTAPIVESTPTPAPPLVRPDPTPLASVPDSAADFLPDAITLGDCLERDLLCVAQAWGNRAYREGAVGVLADFRIAVESPGWFADNCHRVAHVIGGAALAHAEGAVGVAFANGDGICWSGYYHGILERAFRDVPSTDAATIGAAGRTFCLDPEVRRTPFLSYNCLHGLGHGFMLHTGYDLRVSIEACRIAGDPTAPVDEENCLTGVFMENLQTTYGAVSPWIDSADPEYPCTVIRDAARRICYGMVGPMILQSTGMDFTAAAERCTRLSDPSAINPCYSSIGNSAVGGVSWEPAPIAAACRATGPGLLECAVGAALSLTAHYKDGRRAVPFCLALGADPVIRSACVEAVGVVLSDMSATAAEARERCRAEDALPAADLPACLAGTARSMRPHPDSAP